MVSSDSACISETVPLIHMLEHTLHGIMDRALQDRVDDHCSGSPGCIAYASSAIITIAKGDTRDRVIVRKNGEMLM